MFRKPYDIILIIMPLLYLALSYLHLDSLFGEKLNADISLNGLDYMKGLSLSKIVDYIIPISYLIIAGLYTIRIAYEKIHDHEEKITSKKNFKK